MKQNITDVQINVNCFLDNGTETLWNWIKDIGEEFIRDSRILVSFLNINENSTCNIYLIEYHNVFTWRDSYIFYENVS